MTPSICLCLPSTHQTVSKKHIRRRLSVIFVVRGELPDQIKTKLFGFFFFFLFFFFRWTPQKGWKVMVHRWGAQTHTHTHRWTRHYSMAAAYWVISVTDLRLRLLCHQVCHIARLLWRPRRDVKQKPGRQENKVLMHGTVPLWNEIDFTWTYGAWRMRTSRRDTLAQSSLTG